MTVNEGGSVPQYYLGAGVCAVWEYTASTEDEPIIGSVDPLMGIVGNEVTITGRGFGTVNGNVKFGTTTATVVSWSDSCITVIVPDIDAGDYEITLTRGDGKLSGVYPGFKVLSNSQTAIRFKVNATTNYGENVYLVGSVSELGNWSTEFAIGPFYNNTETIATYPTWFFDVSVPANSTIEYKFIKIDGTGNIVWEGGMNHTILTGSSTDEVFVNWQN